MPSASGVGQGDIAPGAGVWFRWLPKEASGVRAAWLTWWADANRAFGPGFSTWLSPPGPLRKRAFHLVSDCLFPRPQVSTLLRVIRNTRAPTWASPGMWDRGGPKVGVQEAW